MLDPATAVGVVSSVVNFVQFAHELISGSSEVYRSANGSTAENTHIEHVIRDLRGVTDKLDAGSLADVKIPRSLRRLSEECGALGDDLLQLLKRLRLDDKENRIWASLVVKWKSMLKKHDVESMERRLGEYRSEIQLEISLLLSEQNGSIYRNLKNEAAQLNSQTAQRLNLIHDRILQGLKNIETMENKSETHFDSLENIQKMLQQLQETTHVIPVQHRILRQLMYPTMYFRQEAIQDADSGTCKWILEEGDGDFDSDQVSVADSNKATVGDSDVAFNDFEGSKTIQPPDNIEVSYSGSTSSTLTHPSDERTVSRDQIDDEDDVSEDDEHPPRIAAESSWNSWAFKSKRTPRHRAKDQFVFWLRSGDGIFHLAGKAGSGKSTLLKYIRNSPRTKDELEKWADGKKLVLAHFYFSNNSGDESQMSLDSLRRSLLFECLKQCPELIQDVFPHQWECLHGGVGDRLIESLEFTPTKITEAFDILITKSTNPNFKFCFFIDGLDEYHGDTYDHWKLAESLRDWATEDIKICASSRPHTEYIQTFLPPRAVRIQLQDINFHDIYQFSCHNFERDRNFDLIKDTHTNLAYSIAEKAEGVFLWAVFAVRECLTSLGYGDSPKTLPQLLNVMPPQLDKLYEKLLESIPRRYRQERDKMLCLALMDPWAAFPARAICYLWTNQLEDPTFPHPEAVPYDEHEIAMHEIHVENQIDKLTKGLLQVMKDHSTHFKRVRFIHRSFREYAQNSLVSGDFSLTFQTSSPGEVYGKILLAEVQCFPNLAAESSGEDDFSLDHRSFSPNIEVSRIINMSRKLGECPTEFWAIPIDLLKRIQTELEMKRNHLPPMRSSVKHQFDGGFQYSIKRQKGSFLHLAAQCGYSAFLINELETNKQLLQDEPADLSFLISAVDGGHSKLISDLLQLGASLYRLVSLYMYVSLNVLGIDIRVPVWMIVAFKALEICLDDRHGHSQVAEWAFFWPNIPRLARKCKVAVTGFSELSELIIVELGWVYLGDILNHFKASPIQSTLEFFKLKLNLQGDNDIRLKCIRERRFRVKQLIYRDYVVGSGSYYMVW